ncbi:MAG: hypothetical protein WCR27_10030 [Eubacteriales bacterium]
MNSLLDKFNKSKLKSKLDPYDAESLKKYFNEIIKSKLTIDDMVDFFTIVRQNIEKFSDRDLILRPFEVGLREGVRGINSTNEWAIEKIMNSFS